jgi:hypothetical protein
VQARTAALAAPRGECCFALRFAMTSLHQVVKATFTLKLSGMLGTQIKSPA